MPDYLIPIVLFFAGASASFINMMAGGGSLITLGLMMTMGIEASIANGTNRIGILVGATSGALTYRQEKIIELKQSLILGACAVPGAILGALYSIRIDDKIFQQVIAIIMIIVLITLFLPKNNGINETTKRKKVLIYPAMFVIGIYGGFIQVGIGYLLMAALRHIMHYDLVKTNMHKIFVVLIYSIPILLVFGLSGKINWYYAIILSSGHAVGSWLSIKLAVKKGDVFVKYILALAVLLMVFKLLITF